MSDPTRDEIAMAVMRCMLDGKAEEAHPDDDPRFYLTLAENIADAILALLAAKREAEADVRRFGPIGTVERERVGPPPRSGTFHKVLPDPPIPHPQTAEPDAWMTTTGATTPTPDKPPRQRPVQYRSILSLRESDPEPPTPDTPKEGDEHE